MLNADRTDASDCLGPHCAHCHGTANCMGTCDQRCEGQREEDRKLEAMVAAYTAGHAAERATA